MPLTTILFSIDGMRPDALKMASTPNIDRLIREGASTMTARTVMPSVTLPCHTSMHRGVDSTRHGITMNVFTPLARPVPSIFDNAARKGLRTGFFYNWPELRDLCEPGSLTTSIMFNDTSSAYSDERVADAASRHIINDSLDLSFVYLGRTDSAGHESGWMSDEYIKAISDADRCVGTLLKSLAVAEIDVQGVLLSDHGGHDRSHGTDIQEDMTIPWIAFGNCVKSGHMISSSVRIFDTCPTIAHMLGLSMAKEWDGLVIEDAFLKS